VLAVDGIRKMGRLMGLEKVDKEERKGTGEMK